MATELYRKNTVEIATVQNNAVVVVATQASMELGEPRDTTVLSFIRNTYPARYNHVVDNMNTINNQTDIKKKYSMRGGHFFLYRYVLLFALLLSFVFGIVSIYVKPCATVPFILSTLYIVITIVNIVIFILNRPLLNEDLTKQVARGQLNGMINRFYTVPVNAQVLTGMIAAVFDPAMIAAAVRRQNIQLTEIDVMLYDDRYLARSRLPKEIIVHLCIFIIMFILAIIFVATSPSR